MVKDSSITRPVNPAANDAVYGQRKREANFSNKLEISASLFLNSMVNKFGSFNCRRQGVIIVADQVRLRGDSMRLISP